MSDINIITLHSDKDLQAFIKEALGGSPVKTIRGCSTIKDAYDLYGKEQSPIIVIDTFLPGTSGLDALKAIRKISENSAIILLARIRTKTFVEKAFRMGATDVLPYPVDKDTFLNSVLHRIKNIKVQEIQFGN